MDESLSEGVKRMVEYAIDGWEKFKRAGMTVKDVIDLTHADRQYPTLGRNFIGPSFEWLVDKRLNNLLNKGK